MKAVFNVSNKITMEVEGNTHKDLFEKLAELQEVFGENECGQCKSENIVFSVREVEGNNFYELRCRDCTARLSYGQTKKDNKLFPKRKYERPDGTKAFDTKYRGWYKFEGAKHKAGT